MVSFNVQFVTDILNDVVSNNELDFDKIDEAIEALENTKKSLNATDDEAIDKLDEIQDYLQYLFVVKEPVMSEIKDELGSIINDLIEWSPSLYKGKNSD